MIEVHADTVTMDGIPVAKLNGAWPTKRQDFVDAINGVDTNIKEQREALELENERLEDRLEAANEKLIAAEQKIEELQREIDDRRRESKDPSKGVASFDSTL